MDRYCFCTRVCTVDGCVLCWSSDKHPPRMLSWTRRNTVRSVHTHTPVTRRAKQSVRSVSHSATLLAGPVRSWAVMASTSSCWHTASCTLGTRPSTATRQVCRLLSFCSFSRVASRSSRRSGSCPAFRSTYHAPAHMPAPATRTVVLSLCLFTHDHMALIFHRGLEAR